MSAPRPVGIDQLQRFDTVIDVRSPAEFAEDHVPGAINCPVLDDDERRIVGTLYAQQGAFEARRLGGGLVAANLARHLREQWADRPAGWRPLVMCWRGGLRSGSTVTWMRMVGWDAQQLAGGYKSFRRHVIQQIDQLAPQLDLRVLCGPTGSGKSRLLPHLVAAGAQVLDLEGLAQHRGSVLGDLPGQPQPSQKGFETNLQTALAGLDLARPVFIEAESRRIGQIHLPTPLLDRMRASPCVEIDAPLAARLQLVLEDYVHLGAEPERLAERLAQLRGLHANERIDQWLAWARGRELALLFEDLMVAHYDPAYARSQRGNFLRLSEARRYPVSGLGADELAGLAAELRQVG